MCSQLLINAVTGEVDFRSKTEPKRGKPGTAPRLEQNPKNLGNIKETSILGSTLLWDVRVHTQQKAVSK